MSAFNDLLKKALAVEREYQKLTSLRGQKLTAKAYLAAALAYARSDAKDLVRLRRELEDAGGLGLNAAQGTLRKMVAAVRSPNYPWPPAPGDLALRHLVPDAALAELANIRATPMQLFALAALLVGERYPESFGAIESYEVWKQRMAELERERAALRARIPTAYDPRDILLDDLDVEGRARVTFALSGGAVPIYPTKTASERLISWLLANPAAEATLS